jgi:outer membrane protein OmpA-like peptidoglycan-associated protein
MIRFCLVSAILFLHPLMSSSQEDLNFIKDDSIHSAGSNDTTDWLFTAPETGQINLLSMMSDIIKNNWSSFFPMGAASFADSVILYDPGAPGEIPGNDPDPKYQKAASSLGVPNYDASQDTGSVSLGRGGCIVLKFSDNILINGTGPDLIVFLSDSNSEEVHVLVSQDGEVYRSIGIVSKEYPFADISPRGESGSRYSYIKLRDNPDGDKNTLKLGADIDAVGAINTALFFTIPADSLFINNSNQFRSSAKNYLSSIAGRIREFPGAAVLIEAHTDDRGTKEYNSIISQQWSGLIRDYFLDEEHLGNVQVHPIGFGESRPLISNASVEGQWKNRRVEILIIR